MPPGAHFIAAVAVLLAPSVSHAAGVSATVDRTSATLEDQIVLTVTVDGSRTEPKLPDLSAFDVQSRGQSTQVRIVNGQMSTSAGYNFVLSPKQAGTFTIGPAKVNIDGQDYESTPIRVTIGAAAQAPAESAPNAAGSVFVTAEVSAPTPYVSQQITYTWRFYQRARVSNASISLPTFEGFFVEELGDERKYETTVRGQQYVVTEIRRALFPQQAGTLHIGGSTLNLEVVVQDRRRNDDFFNSPFDDFFNMGRREAKVLRTPPIDVKVQPLPPPPPGFNNLVGEFSLDGSLSQNNVKVGDSTTLTLTVSGVGNVQHLPEPTLPELPGFKVYDDKPAAAAGVKGDAVAGRKTFKKALVPTKPGAYTIAPVTLVYFDPEAKAYRTASTGPFNLQVQQGDAAPATSSLPDAPLPVAKKDVQVLGEDLLPIYKKADAVTGWSRNVPLFRAFLLAGMGLPPLVYLLLRWWQRRRRDAVAEAQEKRRRTALRRGLKIVESVHSTLGSGKITDAAASASRGLREYVGDKLGIEGLALTPHDVRRALEQRGASPELASEAEGLLQECDAAQYGAAVGGTDRHAAWPTAMKTLLQKLDRSLR